MWVADQIQNPLGIELRNDEIDSYGVEGFIDVDEEEDGSGTPVFDSLFLDILSDNCKQRLYSEIPAAWTSSNFGNDVYRKALGIITHSLGS